MLVGNRERDRARSGSDVEHPRRALPLQELEAALDDDLSLGPRHECARIGLQRQPPEAPFAEHVRERLPLAAPSQEDMESAWHLVLAVRVHAASGHAEHVGEEQLRIDARRVDAGVRERLLGEAQRLGHRHSPSARRRSSAVSALVNSSRSPWSTRSS